MIKTEYFKDKLTFIIDRTPQNGVPSASFMQILLNCHLPEVIAVVDYDIVRCYRL